MQKYNKGDKVKTIDYWSSGRGTVIPKGSIVVRDGIKTNADRIRSMTDEELAEFIDSGCPDCARICPDYKAGCSWTCQHHQGKDFLLKWLQSEAE